MRDLLENEEDHRPKHLFDFDPAGDQENLDDEEMMKPPDLSELPEEDVIPTNSKSNGLLFKQIEVDEHDVMLEMARKLSLEQRIGFDKILQFCKTVLRNRNGASANLHPPQLIITGNLSKYLKNFCHKIELILNITGGGGVGKTTMIRTTTKWVEKTFEKSGPYKPKVLLLACTGAASILIGNKNLPITFNYI